MNTQFPDSPKSHKYSSLINSTQYERVFADKPFYASHQHCLILAKPNELSYNRFGLIVAKKHVTLAVQRNRIKRLFRETFRHLSTKSYGIDAIVLAKKELEKLDNSTITKIVNQQWLRIQKKIHAQKMQRH